MDISGEYTFVVKTAYSIFKNNMSDGKSVKIKISVNSPIIPNPETDDNETDKETNEDINNSTNNETNTDADIQVPTEQKKKKV